MKKNTKSRFLRVRCGDCGNEQVIFGCSASKIKCLVCDKVIAESGGGKTNVKTQILAVLDKDL
jgi:small subunit ribosomal protein S27e